jgi:hypothetical protein
MIVVNTTRLCCESLSCCVEFTLLFVDVLLEQLHNNVWFSVTIDAIDLRHRHGYLGCEDMKLHANLGHNSFSSATESHFRW